MIRFPLTLIFVLLVCACVYPLNARAAEWTADVGDFNDDTNWSSGEVPGPTDDAVVNNAGTAELSGDLGEASVLRLGTISSQSGNFAQTGGTFVSAGAFIGEAGTGAARISDGEFTIGRDSIHVGWLPGGVGEMTIDGPEALVTSADDFQLGREGTGTLQFSAGQLRAGFTVIGKFGTGVWNQTGGLFDQDFGDLEIGDGGRDDQAGTAGPREGTLSLSGGFIQTSGHLAIGNRRGTGKVDVSGGVIAVTGRSNSDIYIGRGADSGVGVGGPTELRISGPDSILVASGSLLMNAAEVAESSILTAAITGSSHSAIRVSGDADVSNGTLKIELDGYEPTANDQWVLVQAGAELEDTLEAIDEQVSEAGYEPMLHEVGDFLGEIIGPFSDVDLSLAPLAGNLEWQVSYTAEEIVLSVIGSEALAGDFNADGLLDAIDIDLLTQEVRAQTNSLPFDLNGDQLVDQADRVVWVTDLKRTYFGDANLDAEFNSGDLVAVFGSGKYENDVQASWSEGDWDGDGQFGTGDLVVAFGSGGYEQGPLPAAAVPEPSSMAILMAALLSIVATRKKGSGFFIG